MSAFSGWGVGRRRTICQLGTDIVRELSGNAKDIRSSRMHEVATAIFSDSLFKLFKGDL